MAKSILTIYYDVQMKTLRKLGEDIDIRLTASELLILCNALNEVLNGIDIAEFETRLGISQKNAEALFLQLKTLLPQRDLDELNTPLRS